jgi:hypothetical protein
MVVLLLGILLVLLLVLLMLVLLRLLLQRNITLLHLSSTVTSSVPTRFSQEIIRAFGLELDM